MVNEEWAYHHVPVTADDVTGDRTVDTGGLETLIPTAATLNLLLYITAMLTLLLDLTVAITLTLLL